jgi:hypothetical protein
MIPVTWVVRVTHTPRIASVLTVTCALLLLLAASGCSSSATSQSTAASTIANTSATASPKLDNGPRGDIPDNATYLTYHGAVYSLQHVEGWVQESAPNNGIRFSDKDSFVSVTLQSNPSGAMTNYARGPGATASASEFQQFASPHVSASSLPAGEVALLTFQALSAPDPVTAKTVMQTYDRYYIRGPEYMAVLTEATPSGVDNVDGFLQIAKSFAWVGH